VVSPPAKLAMQRHVQAKQTSLGWFTCCCFFLQPSNPCC